MELSVSAPDSHAQGARVVWTGSAIELHLRAHLGFAQVEPIEWSQRYKILIGNSQDVVG